MSEEVKKFDVKETLEGLKMVKILAVGGAKVWKDGISTDDLIHLGEVAKQSDEIIAGVKGLDLVDDEFKDMDEQEAVQVLLAIFDIFKEIKEARK